MRTPNADVVHAFGEAAGEDPQQLVQVCAQRAVWRLLDAEALEDRHALGCCDASYRCAYQFLVDAAALRIIGHGHLAKHVPHGVRTVDVSGQKRFVAKVFLHQHRGHGRQTPCVGSGPHSQMNVGHLPQRSTRFGVRRREYEARPPVARGRNAVKSVAPVTVTNCGQVGVGVNRIRLGSAAGDNVR